MRAPFYARDGPVFGHSYAGNLFEARCYGGYFGRSHQVVPGHRQISTQPVAGYPAVTPLTSHSHRLDPAEHLLYSFGHPKAYPVAPMPGRASVYGREPLLRHKRRYSPVPAFRHEILVSSPRSAPTVILPIPATSDSIDNAASRYEVPAAWVSPTSTTKPARLSISRCAPKHSRASLPFPFLASPASGSVVERWVSLLRRSP